MSLAQCYFMDYGAETFSNCCSEGMKTVFPAMKSYFPSHFQEAAEIGPIGSERKHVRSVALIFQQETAAAGKPGSGIRLSLLKTSRRVFGSELQKFWSPLNLGFICTTTRLFKVVNAHPSPTVTKQTSCRGTMRF